MSSSESSEITECRATIKRLEEELRRQESIYNARFKGTEYGWEAQQRRIIRLSASIMVQKARLRLLTSSESEWIDLARFPNSPNATEFRWSLYDKSMVIFKTADTESAHKILWATDGNKDHYVFVTAGNIYRCCTKDYFSPEGEALPPAKELISDPEQLYTNAHLDSYLSKEEKKRAELTEQAVKMFPDLPIPEALKGLHAKLQDDLAAAKRQVQSAEKRVELAEKTLNLEKVVLQQAMMHSEDAGNLVLLSGYMVEDSAAK